MKDPMDKFLKKSLDVKQNHKEFVVGIYAKSSSPIRQASDEREAELDELFLVVSFIQRAHHRTL